MNAGNAAVVFMVLVFLCLAVRKYARQVQEQRLPAGLEQRPQDRALSEDDFDGARTALREFASEYRHTFHHGKCTKEAVMSLHALRDRALEHMYALRMRLPNDLEAEASMTQHIEDTDTLLRAYIRDAQERCGETLLFPGPIDDAFYRQFYRAHNDVVQ